MTFIEIVAAVFGFLCVAFYIRRSFWSWPAGLVQVFLYIAVFWQAKLYADMILHCIYVLLQVYGWWAWHTSRHANNQSDNDRRIRVRTQTIASSILCIVLILIMTTAFSVALMRWTDAKMPIVDSFVAATSLVAQTLLAQRFLENWIYWLVVNSVGIVLFAARGLFPTTILYALFWGMAIIGLVQWYRAYCDQKPAGKLAP